MLKTKKNYAILAIITTIAMLFAGISALIGAIKPSVRVNAFSAAASGTGWAYDGAGKLTITSDDAWSGMSFSSYVAELTEVELGENVQQVADEAFCNSPFTKLTIGKSVRTIGETAFWCGGDNPSTLAIYLEATRSDFASPGKTEEQISSDIVDFLDAVRYGFSRGAMGGLEYVVSDDGAGYYGSNNYVWSNFSARPVEIHFDISIKDIVEQEYGNVENVTLVYDFYKSTTWEFDTVPNTNYMVSVSFTSGSNNDEEFVAIGYYSVVGLYYLDETMEQSGMVVVYDASNSTWNDSYKTISFSENITAIDMSGGPSNGKDITGDFFDWLDSYAALQHADPPETGVVLDIVLPSLVIGLVALTTFIVWKRKEQY